MKKEIVGIFVCTLLFATVLPLSGTVIVEKNTMPTIYDGSLSGYVNDTLMNPIEGALVRVYFHETYEEDYSDGSGYYNVTSIPICYCLKNCTASKEGYNPDWVWMGITDNTTYDFVLTPLNLPRLDPPYGPIEGFVGVDYTFCFDLPDDPECEPYYVIWDWGDGHVTSWIGPYSAGETVCANHSWDEPGDYEVKVAIKDGCGNEYWSDPLTITIHTTTGAELEIEISDYFENKNPIVRYYHGVLIENVGDETANGIAVDFWVSGGIFSKLRERLKVRDYWAYGCGKIEPDEKAYCPISLNWLYLGNVELTAKVWADNADPVTKTVNAFASFGFIWVTSEE
ncbi:MAG: hypothetical protein JSW60_08725 [Thermoplasmatales archaeon]|nr:MAG: hypothetical protein JSW60_08725 [Thermoplasmatales archaeon]